MALTRTALYDAITASDQSFRVDSAAGLVPGMWLLVEGELMAYVSTGVSISGATQVTVRRGINGTKAASHVVDSIVDFGVPADFTDDNLDPNDLTYTNEGDTAERVFPLPEAKAGIKRRFIVDAAQYLKVQAAGADIIHMGAAASAAGGYVRCNIIGGELALESVNDTDWYMTEREEAWSVDS